MHKHLVVYSANQKGSSVADKCPGRTPFAFSEYYDGWL